MKSARIFGVAAVAASMAMAIVSGSAMAESTALCTEDPGAEACSVLAEHAHTVSVGKAKLLTSVLTVECDVLFLGTVGALGSPQLIEGNYTYTNCSNGCTVNEENGPALIEVLREGHETSQATGEALMHVNCSLLNCRYNGVGLASTGTGPLLSTQANGEATVENQIVNKVSGLFCPATSKLDVTSTALNATYIAT